MSAKIIRLAIVPFILFSLASYAQELSPRSHWPAPVGTRVATLGYSYNSGDIVPDRSLPITGVDSDISSLHLGFRQTTSLWGRTANLILEIPYSDGETVGQHSVQGPLSAQYKGLGDLAATLSVNIFGAPAMNRQEFQQMRNNPDPILGVSIKLVAPTGKYNADDLINVGANRWAMKTELGYIAPLGNKWLFEASVGTWFFADNTDFLGVTKEQELIVAVQGHLIHRFNRGFWASLDLNYYEGGRSTIGGRRLDNLQRDSKVGATVVIPFVGKSAIKLSYSKGSLSDSDEDFDTFLVSYQQLF